MYSSSPDLSDLEAPQLMQLVTLAESYGVGKVVADAAKQLYKLSKDSMPLDLAASVFELPEACLELKAIKKVQQAAADKLQQELGDLEVLWGDEGKQQALLGLPFGALLQLLRDERTQVASEDTAVYTALWWLKRAGNCADLEYQQQQLGSVLRPQHCTVTFLARVAVGKTTGWVYANDRWVLEGLLAVAGKSKKKRREWGENEAPDDKAAWRLPPRPRSAVAPLELSWDLPLAEVEDSLAADPNKLVSLDSGARVSRQGRCWWLAFDYEPSTRLLGVFVCVADVPACITAAIWLDTAPGGRAGSVLKLDAAYMRDSLGGALARVGRGEEGWPAVKAWLQQHGLVHPDGCLHLRATITKVA
jgi:hypothetical protein